MATEIPSRAELAPKPGRDPDTPVAELAAVEASQADSRAGAQVRTLLEHWVRAGTSPHRLVVRSRIVLLSLDGLGSRAIAHRLGVSQGTAALWVARFRTQGPEALGHDAPGRGRHPRMTRDDLVTRLRDAGLLRPDGTPLSLRRSAAALGTSPSTVSRILRRRLPSSQ